MNKQRITIRIGRINIATRNIATKESTQNHNPERQGDAKYWIQRISLQFWSILTGNEGVD
jgi:hypothetical protein